MVDYTGPTGNAGTLIIRDDGSSITLLIACSDGATNIGSPGRGWSATINGTPLSGQFTWPSGGGTRVIAGPYAVSTSQTVAFAIAATGTSGLGGPTTISAAINRALPVAPGTPVITRVSDTQHTLAWARNSVYSSVIIQRTSSDGTTWTGWQQIGVAPGNAATFTDTTTVANRRYVYRVAGTAASGQSAWSGQAGIETTPAAPTGIAAARSGNDIVVSAAGVPPFASTFDVRDGSTIVGAGVTLPWTHAAPNPAVPHTYTVRGKTSALDGLWSAPSNTVQLLSPPNAPTGLIPNGGVRPGDEAVRFSWTHNPVDSSVQTAYEMRYRAAGTTPWTTLSGTTDSFRSVTIAVGSWEWQARTKGSHPDWSPWSATATVAVIDRPGVAVTQPDGEWDASTLPVVWSWFQAQSRPQSAWELELLNATGDVVETRSGSGPTTTFPFTTRLTEGEWTVRARAATGEVWSLWASETFDVVFDPPAEPTLTGEWDDAQGAVALSVAPVDDPFAVATVSVLVERSVDDGENWETVVQIVDDAVLLDWESLSYGDVLYRATAYTAEGATASVQITVEARSPAVWLSGGSGFGVTARLPYDPSVQVTPGRQRTTKQYAGRSRPVAMTGEALSRTVAVSGVTTDRDADTADAERLTVLAQTPSDLFLFRDPDGRRIYGVIGDIPMPRRASTSHGSGWEGWWGYSFTLTEATT